LGAVMSGCIPCMHTGIIAVITIGLFLFV
jgi:hypothetical protein